MSSSNLFLTDNDVISVGDFTRQVKDVLEASVPACWIRGEISNMRRQSSGHVYFTLKDRESQLSCVLFRGDADRQKIELRDGMQGVVYGQIRVYEPRGNYQLICRFVLPDGLGKLQQDFERLKQKLLNEGIFEQERKKKLPLLPRVIGIVTSPTGAAIRDFIRILQRRDWKGHVIVLPAKVQGVGAADEIVSMIEQAEAMGLLDVLVVGRGGGSLEDLWCFNEEGVARAVAQCTVPVISAVGHEIDFTLSDFAADVRAETPSAAAELISSSHLQVAQRLNDVESAFEAYIKEALAVHKNSLKLRYQQLITLSPHNRIEQSHLKLDDLSNRFSASIFNQISVHQLQLADAQHRLASVSPRYRIKFLKQKVEHLRMAYQRHLERSIAEKKHTLERLGKRLQTVSIHDVLSRGFAVVRNANGALVTHKKELKVGDRLSNDFQDGEVEVTVTKR